MPPSPRGSLAAIWGGDDSVLLQRHAHEAVTVVAPVQHRRRCRDKVDDDNGEGDHGNNSGEEDHGKEDSNEGNLIISHGQNGKKQHILVKYCKWDI